MAFFYEGCHPITVKIPVIANPKTYSEYVRKRYLPRYPTCLSTWVHVFEYVQERRRPRGCTY